jgi:hypothetical protein
VNALQEMLDELQSNHLEVILVPSKNRDRRDHDMIRVVASRNCDWYRKFCANNLSTRKRRNPRPDTCIKRFRTIDALERMIAGTRSTYYFNQLSDIARKFKTHEHSFKTSPSVEKAHA